MSFPKYKAGPVEYWLAEAATQFLNGAIAGFKIGAVGGGGGGIGLAASPVGDKISPLTNALVTIAGIAVICAAAGAARFHDWHKANEFPNPYPKPSTLTPTADQPKNPAP